nr:MAG TPA: hypothetical protein [Bacteriophage sp.]
MDLLQLKLDSLFYLTTANVYLILFYLQELQDVAIFHLSRHINHHLLSPINDN